MFDNLNMKTKFALTYVLSIILPLIALNYFIFFTTNQRAEQEQMDAIVKACNRVEYELNKSVESAKSISDYIYMNAEISKFLEKSYASPVEYYDDFNNLMSSHVIQYYYPLHSVNGMLIYTDNETITNGTYFMKKSDVEQELWYQEFVNSKKHMILSSYYDENNRYRRFSERARHIVIFRRMNYFGGDDILKLDIDYTELVYCIQNEESDMDIYITDNQKIICTNIDENSRLQDFEALTEQKKKDVEYSREVSVLDGSWNIYITADKNSFFHIMQGQMPILLLLFLMNLILPNISILVIERPIRKRIALLERYIQKVEQGTYEELICKEGRDEIGNIIRSYNLMVVRIKNLIEEVYIKNEKQQALEIAKRQAELNALKSQVNPHFIFNTLESIRMRSFLKKETETANVIGKLAVLMRRVVDWDKSFVSIQEEIEYVNSYLEVQKYRFGERIEFSIHVQEESRDRRIPKFGILTFVENACVHGIEESVEGGSITVLVSEDKEQLYLEILDSGSGMPEEDLELIKKKIANAAIQDLDTSKNVGMLNIMIQYKLYYKGDVKFDIKSNLGQGTEICIWLPLDKNERM